MYRKTSFALFVAAALLVAGAPGAFASHRDSRDSGPNVHQTDLDQEYARTHPLIMPGTAVTIYGYVPPHHAKAKHLTH